MPGRFCWTAKDLADTPPEKRPIHTVFQSYALFPHIDGGREHRLPAQDVRAARRKKHASVCRKALEQVRLTARQENIRTNSPAGKNNAWRLARGLVNRPRLLLLDESLAALDAKLREEVQVELINLQREVGITFIFVTHAQTEALALSHRIAVMNQGKVEQVDEPSRLYEFPRNRFVADFIGHINMVPAQVLESTHGHVRLAVSGLGEIVAPPLPDATVGKNGVFSIRPEQVRIGVHDELTELKNHFTGLVHSLLYQGDVSVYKVKLADGVMIEALFAEFRAGACQTVGCGRCSQTSVGVTMQGCSCMTKPGKKLPSAVRLTRYLVSGPPFLFLLLLFIAPSVIMVLASFRYPGEFGGLAPLAATDPNTLHGVTLETYQFFFSDFIYTEIFIKSILMALATTLICLVMAYPLALLIARSPKKSRDLMVLLVILPFASNFLIRVYAWMIVLGRNRR